MGKLNHICLGITLVSSAFAQSAANFDAKGTGPAASVPVSKSAASPAPGIEVAGPSRYVGEEELEPYVASLVAVLHARGREKDPFGQYQDPSAKPVIKVVSSGVASRASVKATPLSEIVARLAITAIMPGEDSFLMGARRIALGQVIPIVWRGNNLKIEVTAVGSREIAFRNVETDETGLRTMDILPVGMSQGGVTEIMAPGMVPDSPDAPIQLDPGEMNP